VVNKFFSLPVKNIQDECNNVSNEYRIFWSLKPVTNLMREYDSSVMYGDARREIQPTFELFEPITIHGRIFDCYYLGNLLTAATIQHSIDNSMNPLLAIYAKAPQVKGSTTIQGNGRKAWNQSQNTPSCYRSAANYANSE
jgi:hypothetical protein